MKTNDETWNYVKKQFIQNWKTMSDADLEQTKGDKAALVELLQHKFAISPQQAAAAVAEIMPRYENLTLLPDSEQPKVPDRSSESKSNNSDESPAYPNKLYEEELPPDIKLDDMD